MNRERARDVGSASLHQAADDGATSPQGVLAAVASATRLREGPEGVRSILRAIARGGEVTTRQIAVQVRLPLPVVAAVRGELTAVGFLERRPHGARLSGRGERLVQALFGGEASSAAREGTAHDDEMAAFADLLAPTVTARPEADVTLDQAKATPLTLARRIVYLDGNDAIAGRRILFLGDDDFLSAALVHWVLWQRERGRRAEPFRLVVADVDERILRQLRAVAPSVEAVRYDARDALPDDLVGSFDVVITDPPYTLHGAELFLSRAVDAVGGKPGAHSFFSFGHLDPMAMRSVQSALAEMGWVIVEWRPGFNEYEGSSVLAGVSLMAHLVLAEGAAPVIRGRYDGPLYTGDLRPTVRVYRCQGCSAVWEVGQGARWLTVAQLKRQTCPLCGADRFLRVGQRPLA